VVAKFVFFMQKYLLGSSLSQKKAGFSEIKKTPDVRTGVVVPKIIILMTIFFAPASQNISQNDFTLKKLNLMNRGPVIMFGVESKNWKVLEGLVLRVPSCQMHVKESIRTPSRGS
jgi:hypothetical protein